jgi:hypothetical protein
MWTIYDVEHLAYHGTLFLRSKLRQKQITVWLSTSAAHQHDVKVEVGHCLKVSHLCCTSRQRIPPCLCISMPTIGIDRAVETLYGQPDGCPVRFRQGW